MFSYDNPVVRSDMERLSTLDFEAFRGKRVLITGLNGMLATYVAFALLYQNERGLGCRVTGLVRSREKAERRFGALLERPDFSLLEQDVTFPLPEEPFDYIFHLASSASAKAMVSAPVDIIMANVLGTKNVLELARRQPDCRVFLASTREVYGKAEGDTLYEETQGTLDVLSPRSCYPESKRLAENLCAVYHQQYGVKVCIARMAHAYGPGMQLQGDGRIMADVLGSVAERRDVVLKSDGSAKRAFCYLTDAVSAMFTALTHTDGLAVYNIANESEEVSIRTLAELAAGERGLRVICGAAPTDGRAYLTIPRVCLSTEKLEALGWKPQVSLQEGIDRTLRSFL